jgi:two-component system, OmpR family, response regulator
VFYDRSAQAAARTWQPHIVVLDLDEATPPMRKLTRSDRDGHPPSGTLYLAAAHHCPELRGLPVAGNDHLTKPFSIEELATRVRRLARANGTPGHWSADYSIADLELDEDAYVRRLLRPCQLSD